MVNAMVAKPHTHSAAKLYHANIVENHFASKDMIISNAKMAEVNTPAIETGPMIKDPPNISKSGSTDFIQNAPTASDMASIDYYLTRMGLGLQQSKYNALGGMRA